MTPKWKFWKKCMRYLGNVQRHSGKTELINNRDSWAERRVTSYCVYVYRHEGWEISIKRGFLSAVASRLPVNHGRTKSSGISGNARKIPPPTWARGARTRQCGMVGRGAARAWVRVCAAALFTSASSWRGVPSSGAAWWGLHETCTHASLSLTRRRATRSSSSAVSGIDLRVGLTMLDAAVGEQRLGVVSWRAVRLPDALEPQISREHVDR